MIQAVSRVTVTKTCKKTNKSTNTDEKASKGVWDCNSSMCV